MSPSCFYALLFIPKIPGENKGIRGISPDMPAIELRYNRNRGGYE